MKLLAIGFGASALFAGGAKAQGVTVIYPPSPTVVIQAAPPMAIPQYEAPPQPASYLIAFKNNLIRAATAYWTKDGVLYYVTDDHRQLTASLDCVDRALSAQLNYERGVPFTLPAQSYPVQQTRVQPSRVQPTRVRPTQYRRPQSPPQASRAAPAKSGHCVCSNGN
jgi:hypothetical protein